MEKSNKNTNREVTEKELEEKRAMWKRLDDHNGRWERARNYRKLPCSYFEEMGE